MTLVMTTTKLSEATAAGLRQFATALSTRLEKIEGVDIQDMGHKNPFFWAIYRTSIGSEIDSQDARACRIELADFNEYLIEHLPGRVTEEVPCARIHPQAPFLFGLSLPFEGGMMRGELNVLFAGHKEGVVGVKEIRCTVAARINLNSLFLECSAPATFDIEALAVKAEELFVGLRAVCVAVTQDAVRVQIESYERKNTMNI